MLHAPTSDSKTINNIFKQYYHSLYQSEFTANIQDLSLFLQGLTTPTVNPTAAEELDSPLQLKEILDALKTMSNGKSPGPDGYSAEFLKKFADQLAPLLLAVYNESLGRGALPPTLSQAIITVLLKKNKDPMSCSSYRPISLLNVD